MVADVDIAARRALHRLPNFDSITAASRRAQRCTLNLVLLQCDGLTRLSLILYSRISEYVYTHGTPFVARPPVTEGSRVLSCNRTQLTYQASLFTWLACDVCNDITPTTALGPKRETLDHGTCTHRVVPVDSSTEITLPKMGRNHKQGLRYGVQESNRKVPLFLLKENRTEHTQMYGRSRTAPL